MMSDTTNSTQIFNEPNTALPLPNVDLEPTSSDLKLTGLAEPESIIEQTHNALLDQEPYAPMAEEIPDDFLATYFKPRNEQDSWQESTFSFESPTLPTASPTQQIQQELNDQLKQLQQLNQVQSMLSKADNPTKQTTKAPRKQINIGEKLSPMLDDVGGIISTDAVIPFLQLLSKSPTDTHKIFLSVILATKDPIKLTKVIESEGLTLFNTLLTQAKSQSNISHMRLILKVLQQLPVTLKSLRATEIGKTVNKLKKETDPEITTRATEIVKQWMTLLDSDPKKAKPTDKKRAAETKKKEIPKKQVLSSTDDFDSQLSAKKALPQKHKLQLLEDPVAVTKKSIPTVPKPSKPISSDEIKKAKMKEKLSENPTEEKEPPTKKIRTQVPPPIRKFSTVEDKTWNPEEVTSPPPLQVEEEFQPDTLVPGISYKTGKPKKKVTWPSQDKLELVKLFTKEENEHNSHNFQLAKQLEHQKEREARKRQEIPTIPWRIPPPLEIPQDHTIHRGSESKQIAIQQARELIELSAHYIDDKSIPDTPAEPSVKEPDYDDSKTPVIPFDEAAPSQDFAPPVAAPAPIELLNTLSTTPNILENLTAMLGNGAIPPNLAANLSALMPQFVIPPSAPYVPPSNSFNSFPSQLPNNFPVPPANTMFPNQNFPPPNPSFPPPNNFVPRDSFAPPRDNFAPAPSQNFPAPSRDFPAQNQNFPAQSRDFPASSRDFTAQNQNFSAPSRDFGRDNFNNPGFNPGQQNNFNYGPPRDNFPRENFPRENFNNGPPRDNYPPPRDNFSNNGYVPQQAPRGDFRDSYVPPQRENFNRFPRDANYRENDYVAPPPNANLRTAAGSTAGMSKEEIEKKLCHFFTTAKGCRNAANCNFVHDPNARYDPNTNSMKLPSSSSSR